MRKSEHLARKRSSRRKSGSQLVELALVLPILLIVLFGIIQYSLLFWGYVTIRTASAIGGRQAIISPGNTNLIKSAVWGAVNIPPLLQSNQVLVIVNAVPNPSGTLITSVKVSYPFPLFIPFVVPPFIGGHATNKTIAATTVVQ